MMNVTRRAAIRQCFIITAGAALLPSCVQKEIKPLVTLKHLKLDGSQQQLITELSETIIPATDTPGSKATGTNLFVLKMLDDCTAKKDQDEFVRGLTAFDKMAKDKFNTSFAECTAPQRDELVNAVSTGKNIPADVTAFFTTIKKLTVQGYMTSQYYLTNVRVYKLVPGKFKGCVPVTSLNKSGSI